MERSSFDDFFFTETAVITITTINLTLPSYFLLSGLPRLEHLHVWISLPVSFMYLVALLSTFCVLFVIKTEPSLHQPMYLFLSMLLVTDLVQSNSTIPKMLLIFWFNHREISFEGCVVQIFFIHAFSIMNSSVLLAMAFDRYVAVCHPLRHVTILTTPVITKIGILGAMRGILLMLPEVLLLKRLPFCQNHIIKQTYCEHMAVAKISCGDFRINSYYGLFSAFSFVGVDCIFIAASYTLIVMAVLRLPNREDRQKVGNTCVTHICVILVSYISELFSFLSHRFGGHMAETTQMILSNIYLVLPQMFNPIIYGINTKEIQKNVMKIFHFRKSLNL
ncbi:olfactory receptor 52P1-like [Hyla sarda]|uniref:olfactory receptor 52P1-like n=1 Tax=Hyla sarda TaxID=327740 RepID=UPI0024C3D07D|nr:olfactory receptor 52P1-like [Hyla sarda]